LIAENRVGGNVRRRTTEKRPLFIKTDTEHSLGRPLCSKQERKRLKGRNIAQQERGDGLAKGGLQLRVPLPSA